MRKMETLEPGDEYESCRSSVISDLDELEANLYSYVHHERNSCFDEEYSTVLNVSSLEGFGQQNESWGENENFGITSVRLTSGGIQSLAAKDNLSKSSAVNQHGELVNSAAFVTRDESESSCNVQSSDNVPAQIPGEKAKGISEICVQSWDSAPSVLEVSSSDDLDASEGNLSKYRLPAASTPFKEYVVIDDSDDEVKIELERINVKPKKKKRKKSEINADIRLNTRSIPESICLDIDEDAIFSEKENVDSLLCGEGYENSEHETTLCKSWTPQMAQFYDEPWGGECINVSELQRTMSDDGWKVDLSDEFGFMATKVQNRRYFGVKSKAWCTKCKQKGHYRSDCIDKTSQPRCYRCGSSRHQEYSCNQKICLTCGRIRPSLVAVCQQCRQQSWKKCYICQQCGHPPGCCPDLWRRFHATVLPGEIIAPQKVIYKDPKNTYCCNCASRGHHVYQCKKNNFSDYTPMNPKITSYVDPEVLVKFQKTCSRSSTNWESVGAVAPEYQNEGREKHGYLGRGVKRPNSSREKNDFSDRGIKRPKTSDKQQKSKQRKLSKITAPKSASTETVSKKLSKKPDKTVKRNEIKKSVSLKIKKSVRPEKRYCKQDKCTRPVDSEKNPNQNLKFEKDIEHKDTSATKDPPMNTGIKNMETADINPKAGSVERFIVLSPGHLKQIESEEGKEMLKYVTDQFKGVTAKVVNNPSGVLRLMGSGNNIDHVKANLFDILNNKYGLDQLKQSLNTPGNNIKVKKPNRRVNAAVVRSKNIKKKFQNEAHQNSQVEIRSKDQATIVVGNSDLQLKMGKNRNKNKKKLFENNRLKSNFKNGKGNKFNQGKHCNRQSALDGGRSDHMRINPSFDPVVNHSANIRQASSSEVSRCEEDVCDILHDVNQVNDKVSHNGLPKPGSSHSKVKFSIKSNKLSMRNKKKGNSDMAKDKLRAIKLDDGKNGKQVISQANKYNKKLINDLDKLRRIKIEVGINRKVSFLDKYKRYDHSRISENQQCSQNS